MSVTGQEKRDLRGTQFAFLGTVLASGWIKDFSLAIDGGANVGNWAIRMAEKFEKVIAFEPAPQIFSDLLQSTEPFHNIECRRVALLDRLTPIEIMRPVKGKSLRSLYVQPAEDGPLRAVPLDMAGLASCGFIKLDLEGAEYPALIGAEKTIGRFRPTLMVEVDRYGKRFGHAREDVGNLLKFWDYVLVGESRPDQVFIPKERL